MIELYVDPDCRACKIIQDELSQTDLWQRVVTVTEGPKADPPAHCMIDDGQRFVGHRAMAQHLDELAELIESWTRFQSDVCYFEECGR